MPFSARHREVLLADPEILGSMMKVFGYILQTWDNHDIAGFMQLVANIAEGNEDSKDWKTQIEAIFFDPAVYTYYHWIQLRVMQCANDEGLALAKDDLYGREWAVYLMTLLESVLKLTGRGGSQASQDLEAYT